jgi:hydroxymethylpyrimidine pyrophosphatase-like HAD family hydrolase
MQRHELLYRLYEDAATEPLREYQEFVDLFPPVDSRPALEFWETAREEIDRRKREIAAEFPHGETLSAIAARATRDEAFAALDLCAKYERPVNALVLDVDETLRSAGSTDNEIPRETLHLLTEFQEAGTPVIICTGQTLENVKGFAIQGLGSEVVHSGSLAIVYEAGSGVFAPGHGQQTKQLLYDRLDESVRRLFETVRSRALSDAPASVRRGCHLQGNEFNVTLKPNFDVGTDRAKAVVDEALAHLLELLATTLTDDERGPEWVRAYYADADPEIAAALSAVEASTDADADDVPADLRATLDRIDVGYYEADAAEITSLELNKVDGVRAAFDVLGVEDPFALVMGDSKSDLRVMEWVAEEDAGIAAAPEHASADVLEHVRSTDELVFAAGDSAEMLRTAYALNRLAELDGN